MTSRTTTKDETTSTKETRSTVNKIKSFLGQIVRVQISDGRVFEGLFKVYDKESNIILRNATEFRSDGERRAGTVMVPGTCVSKVVLNFGGNV